MKTYNQFLETPLGEDKKWIQKATKNMRKDKPCTGEKFGSETCPPGSKRYNLAKTFRKMAKEAVKYYKGDDRDPTTGFPKGLKPDKRKPGEKPMTAPPYNLAKNEETDKAFEYVKKQIAAKYGKSGYVSKDNPRKPQTDAEKKKVRAHQAKVDKENAAERKKDPSQGRYPKG